MKELINEILENLENEISTSDLQLLKSLQNKLNKIILKNEVELSIRNFEKEKQEINQFLKANRKQLNSSNISEFTTKTERFFLSNLVALE